MALIFYAEDDSLMGELVQETLLAAGHAVGVLEDGQDALRALRGRKPDLAIVDMAMPHMPGSELIKIVRRDPVLYDLPVLVLTARRSAEDEAIAFQAGANAYLRKPFDAAVLVGTVEKVLEQVASRSTPCDPPARTV